MWLEEVVLVWLISRSRGVRGGEIWRQLRFLLFTLYMGKFISHLEVWSMECIVSRFYVKSLQKCLMYKCTKLLASAIQTLKYTSLPSLNAFKRTMSEA